jgi:predicted transcriptional regulator
MQKKRNSIEIMKDILEIVEASYGKIRPTEILCKTNLNYGMMEEYIGKLIQKDFIIEIGVKKSRTYEITEKGRSFLKQYALINEFVNSFGLGRTN